MWQIGGVAHSAFGESKTRDDSVLQFYVKKDAIGDAGFEL